MAIDDPTKFNHNAAGTGTGTACSNTAVRGIISKYSMTGGTASGININHYKIIKNPRAVYWQDVKSTV
jgi:hypothetical protein